MSFTEPQILWVPFCNDGEICPRGMMEDYEESCSKGPHSLVNYANSAWVEKYRTPESVERWEKYLETKDEQFLDSDRELKLGCFPVWCKQCGVRVIRHLIPETSTQAEARERIKDSVCGRCRGTNYTPEELKAQDEYEQTDEAKNMMPRGKWVGDTWQAS